MEMFSIAIFSPEGDTIYTEVPPKIETVLKKKIKSDETQFFLHWNSREVFVRRRDRNDQVVFKMYKPAQTNKDSLLYKMFLAVFEQTSDGVIVIDTNGKVVYLNQNYCNTLGVELKDSLGKHVTKVIPETRMHMVVQNRVPEVGVVWKLKGENLIVTRMPLFHGKEVIGAVGFILFRSSEAMNKLLEKNYDLQRKVEYYREAIAQNHKAKYHFDDIISASGEMQKLMDEAQRIAATNSNIIITGESGTGKELLAHAIHQSSVRNNYSFVKVNCGAIPEELFESELFGYVEGAFTGAKKGGKEGKFELANKGSIFLDEIGEMPLSMQVKLLRVLQEKEVERVGGTSTTAIDVRIIAATNRDLLKMVQEGTFREDLYYRLNVFQLKLPPLRDRKEDIPAIISRLVEIMGREMGRKNLSVDIHAMEILQNYSWPGNIRELRNILERTISMMDGNVIREEFLPAFLLRTQRDAVKKMTRLDENLNYKKSIQDLERRLILKALQSSNGRKTNAAKMLGIARSLLYKKMNDLHIIEEHFTY